MENLTVTGHLVNVTNYKTLVKDIIDLQSNYNPKIVRLQIENLQTVSVNATDSINEMHNAYQAYIKAVKERETAYDLLGALILRSFNAFKVSDVDEKIIETAKSFVRKMQGKRAGKKFTEEELAALAAEGKNVKQISTAQMSYTYRFEFYDQYIIIVANEPNYAPNEEDIQVASLNSHLEIARNCNEMVAITESKLKDARIKRNKVLYAPKTGLVPIALDIKEYIKSVFGANSPEYKKIAALSFKNF